MSRLIAGLTAILLLLLLSQAVLAQYGTSGDLVLAPTTVAAGGQITATGTGFGPTTQVQLSMQQEPMHLGTATTDAKGGFTVALTIPTSCLGHYDVLATGIDEAGSVRVLSGSLTVLSEQVQAASATPAAAQPSFDPTSIGSDPFILATAGAAIVAMTGLFLFLVARRRRSQS